MAASIPKDTGNSAASAPESLGGSPIDRYVMACLVGFAAFSFAAPIWTIGSLALGTLLLALRTWPCVRRTAKNGCVVIMAAVWNDHVSRRAPNRELDGVLGATLEFVFTRALPVVGLCLLAALVGRVARSRQSLALYAFAWAVAVTSLLLDTLAAVGATLPIAFCTGTADDRSDFYRVVLAISFSPAAAVFAVVAWTTSRVAAARPVLGGSAIPTGFAPPGDSLGAAPTRRRRRDLPKSRHPVPICVPTVFRQLLAAACIGEPQHATRRSPKNFPTRSFAERRGDPRLCRYRASGPPVSPV